MRLWPARTVSIELWIRRSSTAMRSWVISKNVGVISSEPNAVVLLYDLTSTYFEGEAAGVECAARGYSRDHRPDTLQVIVALVVTAEGFPLAYEVFDGDTADVTTLEEIVSKIENKYGMKGRVWVFDRGVVSEDNLQGSSSTRSLLSGGYPAP